MCKKVKTILPELRFVDFLGDSSSDQILVFRVILRKLFHTPECTEGKKLLSSRDENKYKLF